MSSIEVLEDGSVVATLPTCTIACSTVADFLSEITLLPFDALLKTAKLEIGINTSADNEQSVTTVSLTSELPSLTPILRKKSVGQTFSIRLEFPTQDPIEIAMTVSEDVFPITHTVALPPNELPTSAILLSTNTELAAVPCVLAFP